jgi:hypothetical protein
MSFIDGAIPLTAGIVLVAFPQIFYKKSAWATDEDVARKRKQLRRIGWVLLVVAASYGAFALTQS